MVDFLLAKNYLKMTSLIFIYQISSITKNLANTKSLADSKALADGKLLLDGELKMLTDIYQISQLSKN